jgi:hypothetical protein
MEAYERILNVHFQPYLLDLSLKPIANYCVQVSTPGFLPIPLFRSVHDNGALVPCFLSCFIVLRAHLCPLFVLYLSHLFVA